MRTSLRVPASLFGRFDRDAIHHALVKRADHALRRHPLLVMGWATAHHRMVRVAHFPDCTVYTLETWVELTDTEDHESGAGRLDIAMG